MKQAALVTVVCSALAFGCTAVAEVPGSMEPVTREATTDEDVYLKVDATDGAQQVGTGAVEVDMITLNGGSATVSVNEDGGPALRFPEFRWISANYPRAALVVRNSSSFDALSPRSKDFTWGAEISLDRLNESDSNTSVDDGNNVIQRGLAGSPRQFKLEVDNRRPTCVVKGSMGAIRVSAPVGIRSRTWYRIKCYRQADSLTIQVTKLDNDRPGPATVETGPVGTVDFEDVDQPMVIGGKIGRDGKLIRSATDQFNGLVRNPWLAIE